MGNTIALPSREILVPHVHFPNVLRNLGGAQQLLDRVLRAGGLGSPLGGASLANPLGVTQAAAASFALTDVANLRWDVDFVNVAKLFQDTARTTPVTTAGQKIMGIADGSPILNHLAQSLSGRAPTYRASGFGSSSVGYGEFDGSDDRIFTSTNPVYGETEWTLYLAYRSRASTSNLSPILHGESSNAKGFNVYDARDGVASMALNSVGVIGAGGGNYVKSSIADSTPQNACVLVTITWKNGDNPPTVIRVNGVNQSPLGGNGSGAYSIVWDVPDFGLSICANPPGNYVANTTPPIDVARFVIYQGKHTATQWSQIEPYLATYCGISI